MNRNAPPSLLRNDLTGTNHWLKVKLIGVQSNRSAIGARVTVHYGEKRQAQEVLAQSSYLSVNDRRLHFGLGNSVSTDLDVPMYPGQTEVRRASRVFQQTNSWSFAREQGLS
ncbi:MAG: ASPIC/UnbV domain-containing protein, partial [Terracidiphilus sp.]